MSVWVVCCVFVLGVSAGAWVTVAVLERPLARLEEELRFRDRGTGEERP